MTAPYVLARATAAPDEEFTSLGALARAIVAVRDRDHGRPGLGWAIGCVAGTLGRDGLPNGRMVAVRVQDGAHKGHGSLVGYAFLPGGEAGAAQLRGAIDAALAARAAA